MESIYGGELIGLVVLIVLIIVLLRIIWMLCYHRTGSNKNVKVDNKEISQIIDYIMVFGDMFLYILKFFVLGTIVCLLVLEGLNEMHVAVAHGPSPWGQVRKHFALAALPVGSASYAWDLIPLLRPSLKESAKALPEAS